MKALALLTAAAVFSLASRPLHKPTEHRTARAKRPHRRRLLRKVRRALGGPTFVPVPFFLGQHRQHAFARTAYVYESHIHLGNDDPDLVSIFGGWGTEDRGRALRGENRPQLNSAPSFNNLIIVNKRVVVNT